MQKWFFTILSALCVWVAVWWYLSLIWSPGSSVEFVATLLALSIIFRGAAQR